MALIDDFKARFPEFDSGAVDTYFPAIEGAYPAYYPVPYSAESAETVLNLLAHLLVGETSTGSDAAQQQVGRTVGPISLQFAAPAENSASASFFGSTKYGQRFWMLAGARRGAFFV